MCGIAVVLHKKTPIEDKKKVSQMLNVQRHRGPDDIGNFHSEFLDVGMVRLSILDLHSANLCPLVYTRPGATAPTHALSFNGEIYNYLEIREELKALGHEFVTTGDTEVLLHAYLEWSEQCLDKFNGMFAFALADFEADTMFLARDIAGEKPLYYYEDSEVLLISSEIKAILTQISLPEVNITEEFRAFEYVTGEETLFKGVYALRPGCKMLVKGLKGNFSSAQTNTYWDVRDHLFEIDPDKAVDLFDELFTEAVTLRLRADVPWGVYLSGGIDSSLIAMIARPEVVFSLGSDQGSKYNELNYAKTVAQEIGCEHVIVKPTKEDFLKQMDQVLYHLDMPTGSFSCFPLYKLAEEASKHVKIVLSGEGADEVFSGYTRYLLLAHELAAYGLPEFQNYHPLLDYYYGKPLDRFSHLLNRGTVPNEVVKAVIGPYFTQFSDVRHAMGYTEFRLMLVTLLHMEDRTSAAFGLENRAPFIDRNLLAFAYSIPGDMKIRQQTTKWIVKEAARRYLPASIVERKDKMGLIVPINIWMNFHGQRGEFDRCSYNQLCMEKWRKVFFQEKWFNSKQ